VLDKIRTYAVFGGLLFYLSRLDDRKSLQDNIESLVNHQAAAFADEVHMIGLSELRNVSDFQATFRRWRRGIRRSRQSIRNRM
jgi:hypothetical protein